MTSCSVPVVGLDTVLRRRIIWSLDGPHSEVAAYRGGGTFTAGRSAVDNFQADVCCRRQYSDKLASQLQQTGVSD